MRVDKSVQVFGYREIPTRHGVSGPRLHDFSAHPELGEMLPGEGQIALGWIDGDQHQILTRSAEFDTMLLVLGGQARLSDERDLQVGDVVTVPAGSSYRLAVTAADGLAALAITFRADTAAETPDEDACSLATLLERNEQRVRNTSQGSMFALVDDGTLDDPAGREEFLRRIRPLSDTFQKIIVARQATCSDQAYESIFLAHLADEFGHNSLLPPDRPATPDPVMNATLSWFTHQMLVRDNAEKAVLVHLVLEAAAEAFFTKPTTKAAFASAGALDYFHAHLEDEAHKDLGAQLLTGLHPLTYRRLHRMLEDGWDMFDAMSNRLAELVRAEVHGAA
ncbi:hypothetical protein A5634_03320 [Mycobacterium asiaticum]|uniref:AraC-type arabinose-binding/dimerisation domain-containing protein n=1 Tax=Mycobacterium asiaticum TaxID=1790 RepID=A0A1A3NQL1_MYCAS|nr:hypothetical protein A5634_03320 [Mycobacterium asiaticum]